MKLPTAASKIGPFIVALLLWQLAAATAVSTHPSLGPFLPTPLQAIFAIREMVLDKEFWLDMSWSNIRVACASLFSYAVAVALSVALACQPRIRALVGPILNFLRFVPVAAIVPVSIIWLGIGETQKAFVLFCGATTHATALATAALAHVPSEQIDAARTLGVRGLSLTLRVQLPAAAPELLSGLRVTVGLVWSYLLVAEIVAAEHGIGYAIVRAQRFLRVDQACSLAIIVGLLGLLYDIMIKSTAKKLLPHHLSQHDSSIPYGRR